MKRACAVCRFASAAPFPALVDHARTAAVRPHLRTPSSLFLPAFVSFSMTRDSNNNNNDRAATDEAGRKEGRGGEGNYIWMYIYIYMYCIVLGPSPVGL